MGQSVKKQAITSVLENYESKFQLAVDAALDFEEHENKGEKLLYLALEQLFAFGEEIRHDNATFQEFLENRDKALNKVTRQNPYNALVDLAFTRKASKSWRSEISNVLRLASELHIEEPLHECAAH